MNTPIFTTSRPGWFCDASNCNEEFIKKITGDKKLFCSDLKGLYIDGKLEELLGYDIPIWLSGEITGGTQDCIIWNVEGDIAYAAEITYGHIQHDEPHVYIRFKEIT